MKKVFKCLVGMFAVVGVMVLIAALIGTVYPTKQSKYDQNGRRIISKDVLMTNAKDNLGNQKIILEYGFECDYVDKGWIDYSTYTITTICNSGKLTYKIAPDIKSGTLAVFQM